MKQHEIANKLNQLSENRKENLVYRGKLGIQLKEAEREVLRARMTVNSIKNQLQEVDNYHLELETEMAELDGRLKQLTIAGKVAKRPSRQSHTQVIKPTTVAEGLEALKHLSKAQLRELLSQLDK